MALNDVIFIKGQGGLGRPLAGEDYISGLLFNTDLAYTWSTGDVRLLTSVADAETNGIYGDFRLATPASSPCAVSDMGADGDTVTLTAQALDATGNEVTVTLASYTKVAADTTDAMVAASIVALINARTYTTGFSATDDGGGDFTVIAPKALGSWINTTSVSTVSTGTIAISSTSFTDGLNDLTAVYHYHISEFFRLQPKGLLYVAFESVATNFASIETMQNFAGGKIRQVAVWTSEAFSSANLTTIQGLCNTLSLVHKPLSALYAGLVTYGTDLTTLADLSLLTDSNVSAVIGQDAGGLGNFLYNVQADETEISISNIGATLGAVSLSKVSEDIAWVSKFNMSNGVELDTVGFVNGQLLSTASQNLLTLLDSRRYIFLIKYVGITGSYTNDSHTAIAVNSDYAYIENNRTIDKAIRGVYTSMLPNLASPLVLNADGTLSDNTVAYFESQAAINLNQMVRDVELSAFSVVIDPSQNVLSTSTLVITIALVPIGVARHIQVNIGFTLSI